MAMSHRGFTLKELTTTMGLVAVFSALTLVLVARGRQLAREQQDATQVRVVLQSLVIWIVGNNDSYPLPSRIDPDPSPTVPEWGFAKNTTANIYSILLWQGVVTPELLVSPLEVNPRIRPCRNYQLQTPRAAVDPPNANWDPAFSVDFSNGNIGHASYAHLQLSQNRRERWRDTCTTDEVVFANRGPEVVSVSVDPDGTRHFRTRLADSNTFLIHGPRSTWEGNVGFNDGHIEFITTPSPQPESQPGGRQWTYENAQHKPRPDCLFFDEPDDANQSNVFLGLWIKAGDRAGEFQGIWD